MGNHVFPLRLGLILSLILCALPMPVKAQETAERVPPTLHFGDWLSAQPRAKIQLDFSGFRPELDDKRKIFQGRRVRFGIDGALFRDLAYTVRVETRRNPEFRDVFLRYQHFQTIQLQAGRFKIPFGLDQLTDSGELDFVQRSRIGSIVAPGRDTGAMITGDLQEHTIHYSAGIFQHDGRNTEIEDFAVTNKSLPGGNRTAAARLTVEPASLLHVSTPLRHLTIGAAFTHSDLAAGLSSLPGVTVSNEVFFPRLYVNGRRMRRGAELTWTAGLLSIKGELMDATEQRRGQGLHGEDLPALRTRGWYVSAVHPLFGQINNAPKGGLLSSILPIRSLGRVDATARYEAIRFGSTSSGGALPGSRDPRAANVAGNEDRAWTLGINWQASRYLKLQFNGVHEALHDPVRDPIDGESQYWTVVGRIQLYF